jgi:hypothetical protein
MWFLGPKEKLQARHKRKPYAVMVLGFHTPATAKQTSEEGREEW